MYRDCISPRNQISDVQQQLLDLVDDAGRIERRLDRSLGAITGISFSEYRILHSLRAQPEGAASRVDLSESVGLTPSAVTRALKPLEARGFVQTRKNTRDARQALATLTAAGFELVDDAVGVVNDHAPELLRR